jgi:uncharacterized protein (DUF1501 family)
VFQFGGNEATTRSSCSTAPAAQYAAVRSVRLQLAQAQLLPIAPASAAVPYGLHPSLPELQALFGARKLAILANVGTLVQPTTKTQYQAKQVPLSLYSHSDQQAQWQSSISHQVAGTVGGRLADAMALFNAGSVFWSSRRSTVRAVRDGKASAPLRFRCPGRSRLPVTTTALPVPRVRRAEEWQPGDSAVGDDNRSANTNSPSRRSSAALPAGNTIGKALYQSPRRPAPTQPILATFGSMVMSQL